MVRSLGLRPCHAPRMRFLQLRAQTSLSSVPSFLEHNPSTSLCDDSRKIVHEESVSTTSLAHQLLKAPHFRNVVLVALARRTTPKPSKIKVNQVDRETPRRAGLPRTQISFCKNIYLESVRAKVPDEASAPQEFLLSLRGAPAHVALVLGAD